LLVTSYYEVLANKKGNKRKRARKRPQDDFIVNKNGYSCQKSTLPGEKIYINFSKLIFLIVPSLVNSVTGPEFNPQIELSRQLLRQ
jgi:hypothetical protein